MSAINKSTHPCWYVPCSGRRGHMDIYVCTYAPEESASTECSTECV